MKLTIFIAALFAATTTLAFVPDEGEDVTSLSCYANYKVVAGNAFAEAGLAASSDEVVSTDVISSSVSSLQSTESGLAGRVFFQSSSLDAENSQFDGEAVVTNGSVFMEINGNADEKEIFEIDLASMMSASGVKIELETSGTYFGKISEQEIVGVEVTCSIE